MNIIAGLLIIIGYSGLMTADIDTQEREYLAWSTWAMLSGVVIGEAINQAEPDTVYIVPAIEQDAKDF